MSQALWLEAAEPDRNFYQGILQIAVACYHLGNQNLRGATILLGEGIRRLQPYQPSWQGLNLSQFLQESQGLLALLQQLALEREGEGGRQEILFPPLTIPPIPS